MKKCAIFCSFGLGDGLLFLILSHNLELNGYQTTTYHNSLDQLKNWFINLNIKKYPDISDVYEELCQYDLIIINKDSNTVNKEIQKISKRDFSKITYFLKPTTYKGKRDLKKEYLHPEISMAQNLVNFCNNELNLKNVIKSNGITPLKNLQFKKFKRVVIHPTSRQSSRNWPREKFIKLAKLLKLKKYDVSFVMSREEREHWIDIKKHGIDLPSFENLSKLAQYIYESKFFIGNDSGVSHLASCLNIPSLTIFTTKRKVALWKSDFSYSKQIWPWSILPNIKGLRLRDKYWKKLISTNCVYRKFNKLEKEGI
jgi:heptosyltransferase III